MVKGVYGAIARVFAVLLAVVGIAVIYGGMFAHGFVTDQLTRERTPMPDEQGITALKNKDAQDALKPYQGHMMSTGP